MPTSKTAPSKKPTFFATPAKFRTWLEFHHATKKELHLSTDNVSTGAPK